MRLLYSSIAEAAGAQVALTDYSADPGILLRALSQAASRIDSILSALYTLPLSTRATGQAVVASVPVDGTTLTISSVTYRWKTTPAQVNDITIGATVAACGVNLARTLNASSQGGYYSGTDINPDVEATAEAATVPLRVRFGGVGGNVLTLSSSSAAVTVTAFAGGAGDYPALEWINQILAVSILMRGRNLAGGQVQADQQPQDYWKQAMDALSALAAGDEALLDVDGIPAAWKATALPVSDTMDYAPASDEGDPTTWGHDTARDWDRD